MDLTPYIKKNSIAIEQLSKTVIDQNLPHSVFGFPKLSDFLISKFKGNKNYVLIPYEKLNAIQVRTNLELHVLSSFLEMSKTKLKQYMIDEKCVPEKTYVMIIIDDKNQTVTKTG